MRAYLVLIAVLGWTVTASAQSVKDTRAIEWANGTFEILVNEASDNTVTPLGCGDNKIQLRTDKDALRFTYIDQKMTAIAGADIIDYGPQYFMIRYDDPDLISDGVSDRGLAEIWIMFFDTPDEFYWVRQDWLDNGGFQRTDKRRRCTLVS